MFKFYCDRCGEERISHSRVMLDSILLADICSDCVIVLKAWLTDNKKKQQCQ